MKDKNLWNTNTISLYTPENFFFNNFSLAVGQIWHAFLNDFFFISDHEKEKIFRRNEEEREKGKNKNKKWNKEK